MLVLLHRPPSCIMCRDKASCPCYRSIHSASVGLVTQAAIRHHVHRQNGVPATGGRTLKALVQLQRPPSCIMCRDKHAVLVTRPCTLAVLVLLRKPPSCITCVDKLLSLLQEHAFWKCRSCYTDHHAASCAQKNDVNATVACTLEVFVLLHRSKSCPMCWDRNVVPATRARSVEVLVLPHRTPSCIMCVDTAAVLGSRACILEALVLLHKLQCCIMCSDKNAALGTRACTLEVLVLLNKPQSCVMCRDKAVVHITKATRHAARAGCIHHACCESCNSCGLL